MKVMTEDLDDRKKNIFLFEKYVTVLKMEIQDICYTKFISDKGREDFSEKITISSRDSLHAVYRQILEMTNQTKMDFDTAMTKINEAYQRKDISSIKAVFADPLFNPMARDKSRNTIFHKACESFSPMIVYLLLDDPRVDPDSVNNRGETPLFTVCQTGRAEIVHILLTNRKIDPTIIDTMSWTALHAACFHGHVKIVDMLLRDSRINPNAKNVYSNTVLYMACENMDLKMVELLLQDPRVDPNIRSRGIRPLKIVASRLKMIRKDKTRDYSREDIWIMNSIFEILRPKTKMNPWTMLRDFFEF